MKPCRHLDYDEAKYAPGCTLRERHDIKFWERSDEDVRDFDCKRNVQFCKLRGRINDMLACYVGDFSCYEPE